MSYIEAFELLCHLQRGIEIGDEVITSDLVLPAKLVCDMFRIAVGLEVPYSILVRQLQTNEQGVVLHNIVSARFSKGECARDDMVLGRNEYDSNPGHQSCARNGSRCSVEVHLPNRGAGLSGMYLGSFIW